MINIDKCKENTIVIENGDPGFMMDNSMKWRFSVAVKGANQHWETQEKDKELAENFHPMRSLHCSLPILDS